MDLNEITFIDKNGERLLLLLVASEDDVQIPEQLDAILHDSATGEEKRQTDAILRLNAPKNGKRLRGGAS